VGARPAPGRWRRWGLAARRGHDLHAAAGDRCFQQAPLNGIVVHDKNGLRHDKAFQLFEGRIFAATGKCGV
jgi:hypothetical protein